MLAGVVKNFSYILTVLKMVLKNIIYFWTFDEFIGNVRDNAISQQQ